MLSPQIIAGPIVEPVTLALAKAQSRVDLTYTDDDVLFNVYIPGARALAEKLCQRGFFNQTWVRTLDGFPFAGNFGSAISSADRWNWANYGTMWNQLAIDLPGGRVVSVISVTYGDMNGQTVTLSPTLYNADLNSVPCRLTPANGLVWPWQGTFLPGSVQITYEVANFVQAVAENFTAPTAAPYTYTLLQTPQTAIQGVTQLVSGVVTPLTGWSAAGGVLTLPPTAAGLALTVNYSIPNMPPDLLIALMMLTEHFYRNPGATTDLKLAETPLGIQNILTKYVVEWTDYRPC